VLTARSTLVDEPNSDGSASCFEAFMACYNISHITITCPTNKEVVGISDAFMQQLLGIVCNPANYPLLIHCNKGKHRTGCTVGALRKVLGWNMENIVKEYHQYAGRKARVWDERFLEVLDIAPMERIIGKDVLDSLKKSSGCIQE
jgi:tyrosine-protein phosphatase SIW14